jgi:LmbE family N-acetylglucosaminyl deacetylase
VQDWLSADRPPPLDLSECARLVVVAPHPDDETLGIGATAAQLAASGVDVQAVSASDGGGARPDVSAAERLRLEATRRSELLEATSILGMGRPLSLGLPHGHLCEHEYRLTGLLVEILDGAAPGTWCAATWRGDGHPDHEAVGRAAAAACARTGVTLVEYPVWMWHWATPADPDVPWQCAYAVPLAHWAVERKNQAAQCFHSQFEPYGSEAVLPPFVLQRLMAVGEVVFR